jgi:hypothetical protein
MIHDFFFEYQDNELLGKIDNAALILADKSPYLARDPRCLELSKFHSFAVDFGKKGVMP